MVATKTLEFPQIERRSIRRRSLYRPELDAVRLLAFLLIFVHHNMNGEEGSYVGSRFGPIILTIARVTGYGLSLFFVLSAFLISDLLIREKREFKTINIAAFYKRRILRIWPLYIFGLMIGWFVSYKSGHPETARFLSFFGLLGNWYTIKFGWIDNPMTPLWSISVEEQFYLFWPSVARRFTDKGLAIVCLSLIAFANLLLIYFGLVKANQDSTIWCNTFIEFEMFAAGILLALRLRQSVPSFPIATRIGLALCALAAWTFSAFVCKPINRAIPLSPAHLVLGYALIALGCCLVLLSVLGVDSKMVPKWVAYLGRISFGLYVYHELAIDLTDQLFRNSHGGVVHLLSKIAGLGLTILFAAISYRYLETPFLNLKSKFELIKTRPV